MNNTNDDPIYLMKSISYNLKRIADAMESYSTDKKPTLMSETFEYKPQAAITSDALRIFLNNLGK
jgi:hypothetical protein